MTEPKTFWQSASRIDTFEFCSNQYAAKYLYKLPDSGNDGSNRGNVCHETLEILDKPRHHKRIEQAVRYGSCKKVRPLWKLLQRFALRYHVADPDNLDIIDDCMMVALKNEFHGPAGTVEAFAEREFNISVNQGGKRYNVRGYIDRTFKVKDQMGLIVHCMDWKTSKSKFKGDKVDFNFQSLIYQLALRHLHPDITRRSFHFLFLKFKRTPRQDQPSFTDSELNGFEYVLTDLQERMENFTENNIRDNLATYDQDKVRLCGGDGVKADGSPRWKCTSQDPMDYWVRLKGGSITESSFIPLLPQPDTDVEKRHYPGCVAYWKDGIRIRST